MFDLQGLVKNLLEKLIDNGEIGSVIPQWDSDDLVTPESPEKKKKLK